jgi:cytochrome c biogenesis factor
VTVVGELALWVALFLAVWGSVASFGGAATHRPEFVVSGVRSIFAAALMVVFACLGLWAALLTHDFSLGYVASHTTLNTPTLYLIAAFWAGPSGAMLSFALALSVCATAAVSSQRREAETLPWAVAAFAAVLALVLIALCFVTNPYDRVEWVPAEGAGLNPRLQSALALPYFVATYGAYGAATVLFALAFSAVATRRVDARWYSALRRWSVIAWCLFTVSIAVRMRWTYLEPLAGGLWRPDVAHAANAVAWVLSLVLLRSLPGVARLPGGDQGLPGPKAQRSSASLAIYLGLGVLAAGLVARRSWTEHVISLRPGGATELTDPFDRRWRFVSQGLSRDERMNYLSTGVAVEAWRDGREAGIISAERRQYLDSMQRPTFEPAPKPGIRSTPALDVYLVLAEVRGQAAQIRVGFRPLVTLVWIGWVLVAVGGLALATASTGRAASAS